MAKRKQRSDKGKPRAKAKEEVGLGDVVEAVTEATGIKKVVEAITDDCGCNERKEWLNQFEAPGALVRLAAFLKRSTPEKLTEAEYNSLTDILDSKHVDKPTQDKIADIYNRVFRVKVKCTKCAAARMVKQLRMVYADQKDEFCKE